MDIEAILKALAHPARFGIVSALCDREMCVSDLQALLKKRQAYVSQQLARLRGVGLVRCRREAGFCYYSLADPMMADLLRVMEVFCANKQTAIPGLRFRIRGHLLERNVIPTLYGVLWCHPCDIDSLVILVPTLKASWLEGNASIASFILSHIQSGNEMTVCPGLVRNVLNRLGCEILPV